jgi:hypothetical protein
MTLPTDDVDVTAHALTLKEAAPALLETMSRNLREYTGDDPDKPKTEKELRFLRVIDANAPAVLSGSGD